MKRAWPYALALAVVVTGCYLALAPLLRSLSPAPTTSASQLGQTKNTNTVGPTKPLVFGVSKNHGSSTFVTNLTTKKKTKKAKKSTANVDSSGSSTITTPAQSSSTGFANNTPTTSAGSTPTAKKPSSSSSSTGKTAAKKASSVGGGIDQQSGAGFAGPEGSGSSTYSQKLDPGN